MLSQSPPRSRKLSAPKVPTKQQQLRRSRGEIACAECRRLKLKCDRQIPCSSCIRRSCADICPNGHADKATTTHGKILSMSDRLRQKITELTQRVRQLEDALAVLQATVSPEPHPLLVIQNESDKEVSTDEDGVEVDKIVNAMGSLLITERGQTFFGPTAGSETLFLRAADASDIAAEGDMSNRPAAMTKRSAMLSFFHGGALDEEVSIYTIIQLLPDQNRAWALCETYFQHANWGQHLIDRDELVDELMIPLYKFAAKESSASSPGPVPLSCHQIATLYCVFALGALTDLTLPEFNSEADEYYQLARASMSLHDAYDSLEVAAIQALALAATYHSLAAGGEHYNMDIAWRPLSLACLIAHSIGLHRDPGGWGLEPKVVRRRRYVFWELCSMDTTFSLVTGRPPIFSRVYIDCQYPDEGEQTKDSSSTSWNWKYRFTGEIDLSINEITLQAKAPTYEAILEMDQKIRDHPLAPSLSTGVSESDSAHPPAQHMRNVLMEQTRAVATIHLHRQFFVRAMLDHPVNPLRSKYATSFLAASRSATEVIKSTKRCYELHPQLCRRWWNSFNHLFSAAMITGSIVVRIPSSSMAIVAYEDLRTAVDLFSKILSRTRSGRYGQVILERLLAKATKVFHDHLSGSSDPRGPPTDASDDTELAIFGGHTLVHQVETKSLSSSSPKHTYPVNINSESSPSDQPLMSSSPPQRGHIHSDNPQSGDGGDNDGHSPTSTTSAPVPIRPAIHADMPMPIYDDGASAFHETHGHQAFAELSNQYHQHHHHQPPPMTLPSYSGQLQEDDLMFLRSVPDWTNLATSHHHPHHPTWLTPEPDGQMFFPDLQMGYSNLNQGYTGEREVVDERWVAFMRDAGILDGLLTSVTSDSGTLF